MRHAGLPILYHCIDARSFRVLWTMAEMDVDCDLRMLPFPPRLFERSYLDVNPLGTVPLFLDGEARMTESVAICQYLVARHGPSSLEVRPDEADYGAYLNWLHHGEATLTFPQTIYLRYARLEPAERRNRQAADDYRRWFLARLRALEAAVETQDSLCAGRFTIADISVGFALLLAEAIGIDGDLPPSVARYWTLLKQREGFRKARRIEERERAAQGVAVTVLPAE